MKRAIAILLVCAPLLLLSFCHMPSAARSNHCFDEIRTMVEGRSAADVETMLGEPDTRQPMLSAEERWIWWNYTYLDGSTYAPEVRGQVVHLEITFERPPDRPDGSRPGYSEWRISRTLGVTYSLPAQKI